MEITHSGRDEGMALASHDDTSWDKRDVIHHTDTWDLTLDDTPGTDKRNAEGELDDEGAYRQFNLEFNIHGGGRGFADNQLPKLKAAIVSVQEFCNAKHQSAPINADAFRKPKGKLEVFYPQKDPESANIQLTAGASLAGLQQALAINKRAGGKSKAGGTTDNPMTALAVESGRVRLAESYIPPDEIAKAILGPDLEPQALRALSTMFTLIKTFLDNYEKEKEEEDVNVKEAAPLLWKTPLTLFFESSDLGLYKETIFPMWPELVETLFGQHTVKVIEYVPGNNVNVMEWLTNLPTKDSLTEADQEYNKSFGGIGTLEGGVESYGETLGGKGSFGHPIFEFRSIPGNNLTELTKNLDSIIAALGTINELAPLTRVTLRLWRSKFRSEPRNA
jgi:hypothetical protein